MSIAVTVLAILGGALIGSSVSPFFFALLEPKDEFSVAPTLVRMGIALIVVGAILWGVAFLLAGNS